MPRKKFLPGDHDPSPYRRELSPSRGLNEKTEAYLSLPSLRVLLLAESDTQTVIIHRRDSTGLYEGANLPAAMPSESPRG